MSCTFTCTGCGKTANAEYRYGRWQHPDGWWTRPDTMTHGNTGVTACSRECVDRIEARVLRKGDEPGTVRWRAA